MNTLPLLLAHGWAYTPGFFEPWLKQASERLHLGRILALNQGYFEPNTPPHWMEWQAHTQTWQRTNAPNAQAPCIGLGHSLGFAKLLALPLPWQQLISINGFTQFPPSLALRQMVRHSKTTLPRVIDTFQEQCGAPMPPPCVFNQSALVNDLESLRTLNSTTDLQRHIAHGASLVHIACTQDRIIPATHSTACFSHLPSHQAHIHPQEGTHSDIYTHPTRYTWLFDFLQRSALF